MESLHLLVDITESNAEVRIRVLGEHKGSHQRGEYLS